MLLFFSILPLNHYTLSYTLSLCLQFYNDSFMDKIGVVSDSSLKLELC